MPFIAFLVSAALAAAVVPVILLYARRKGLFDRQNERTIHRGSIPRLGGLGIFVSFAATIAIFSIWQSEKVYELAETLNVLPLILSALLIFAMGFIDDLVNLKAWLKFAIELCLGIYLVMAGFRFRSIPVPWGSGAIDLGWFSYPLTVMWIIGVTNALNLIDGMDGLAGGVAAISSFTFAVLFYMQGYRLSAQFCFALTGACMGFLLYNLPDACIFMGDSGSLFLGFTLSMLPLLPHQAMGEETGLLSSSVLLSIPIFDTLMAILRRKRAGRSFFHADKGHIHHCLLARGLSTRQALGVLYGIMLVLSATVLSALALPIRYCFPLQLCVLAAVLSFFFSMGTSRIEEENPGEAKPGLS